MQVDVCHPLYNMRGIGIADGGENDMAEAVSSLHDAGTGIFCMKALGGGHMCASAAEAFSFVLSKNWIDAVAVGMQSKEEVRANIRFFSEGNFAESDRKKLLSKKRILHVEDYCEGCGRCVKRCGQGALKLIPRAETESIHGDFTSDFTLPDNMRERPFTASADDSKCVRCGYCTSVCPVFALKIY